MKNNSFPMQEVAAALSKIVNTATPLERAEVLRANCELLLSDASIQLLSNNLEQMKQQNDEQGVQVFSSVLRLLNSSREKGLDAGIAELETEDAYNTVWRFVNCSSWAERIEVFVEHQDVLLGETARHAVEGLLETNQQNQRALQLLRAISAMLDVGRNEGAARSIEWLQTQLLGSLMKYASAGDLESASGMIGEITSIADDENWYDVNSRIADILIQQIGGKHNFLWVVEKITDAIDHAPSPVNSVLLYLKLIDFLVTSEDSERIEHALTHLRSIMIGLEKEGSSFRGVYGTLGRSFLFRTAGERQENLRKAREFLERELETDDKTDDPQTWATTHRLLGTVFEELGDAAAAILHFEQGVSVLPTEPNAGFASAALSLRKLRMGGFGAVGDQTAVEEAINDLNRGLSAAPEDTEVWAWIHAELGDLSRQRQGGDPAENFDQAYFHANQALRVFTKKTHKDEWAQIQHNLGTIYYSDVFHDRADNLEKAINCYRHTLEIHTKKKYPQYYGLTNNSLGLALLQRLVGKRERNYQEAFQCFKEAESVLDPEASKVWWAECMTGLGSIYMDLVRPNRKENLLQAAQYMDRASKAYSQMGIQEREMTALSNLAVIYTELSEFDPDAYSKAIQYAEAALGSTSQETNPYQWALFNRNLAAALSRQVKKTQADFFRIRECLQNALKVFTPEVYPAEYRLTTSYLGHICYDLGEWAEALEAYQSSVQAGEALMSSAYTEPGRKAEARETELVYIQAAYCLVRLGRYDEALMMVEAGKARLIAEKLTFSELDPADIPEDLAGRLHHAREINRSLEGQMRLATSLRTIDTSELGSRLRDSRALLNDLTAEIQEYNPSFGGRLQSFQEIVDQIPENGALVAFLITNYGTVVFAVPAGTRTLRPENILEIPDFTEDVINQLLDQQSPYSWVALLQAATDIQTTQQFKEWLGQQADFMGALWNALIGPTAAKLTELGIQRGSPVLFLQQGGLWLLAIHAASRQMDGNQRSLADDYVVLYTPSIYARKVCIERNAYRQDEPPTLLAVVNPGGDLPYSDKEVALISHHFQDPILLPGNEAKLEKVLRQAGSTSYLHFSCHGYHDWEDTMLSGLELATPDHLLLSEILAKLSLNKTRLVTLSACETGIIDLRGNPNEFVGLSTGFLVAGANGVITTLWKVDDAASCLLISAFYEYHLKEQMQPAEALRAAQKWLRELTLERIYAIKDIDGDAINKRYQQWIGEISLVERVFDNPFFWAGFVYVGA